MEDYKPNSHKYREEQKKAEVTERKADSIISGNAKVNKKTETKKLLDMFISEDAANIKNFVIMDVLVPSVKRAISDIVTNGINMILYGEKRSSSNRFADSVSWTDYNSISKQNKSSNIAAQNFTSYENISYERRGDAEVVLERLEEMLDRYGVIKVSDIYDLSALTPPYTANRYGWTSISGATIVNTRDGWVIRMPKAKALD